jgi:hypothetical protein
VVDKSTAFTNDRLQRSKEVTLLELSKSNQSTRDLSGVPSSDVAPVYYLLISYCEKTPFVLVLDFSYSVHRENEEFGEHRYDIKTLAYFVNSNINEDLLN